MLHLLFLSFFSFLSPAHGDIHERIMLLSERIKQHPDSTELYQARGELYLLHGDKKEAREDFNFCLEKELKTDRVFLGLSKTLYAQQLPDSSLYFVDQALALNSINPTCLEWRGFVLQSLDQFCLSAKTYEHLLAITINPSPSLYIDAAESWMACYETSAEENAISILRAGLDRLGKLHILEKKLVAAYVHYNRFEDALSLQTEMVSHWSLKALPYFERAKIYNSLGDSVAAIDDLRAAIASLDQLPYYKTNTSAMKTIRKEIVALLNQTIK